MLGYEHPQQIIGQLRVSELVAPADRQRVQQQLQLRFEQPGKEVSYGFTGLRRDGSTVELDVHGRGLQTLNGNVVIGLALDVTDRRRNEIALREKQALLDRMSTLAKVGGWSIDVLTGVGTRTDGAARILDLDPSKPDSLTFRDGLKYFQGEHHDRISQTLQRAVEHGEPYALELQTSSQGHTKWIRTQGEPIWQDGRVVRIEGAIQDISEVRQARAELQAHQERLEQMVRERTAELEAARHEAERLSRIKSEFLANMSHEIRTPLNGVLGLAQIGARDHDGHAREVFEQINASGRLLLGVINDILDFSKIEAGKLRIELQPLRLRDLLERSVATVRERADEKGLALRIDLDASLPATCISDALRLEQVLLNLLSNAVKFTPRGEVCLSACAQEGRLMLAVTDTGIGMSASQVERLFHPFEQADGSTTRRFGGTGLGLTISRRLVEMLGGDIRTHSEPGVGTRFEIWLPLVTELPTSAAARASGASDAAQAWPTPSGMPESVTARRLSGLRVLAAEDNAVNQLVLTELLAIEGAQVAMCDSGADALVRLQTQGRGAFDVVLMDIQMPGMDGYEATRQIRAFAPDLPVIGQTAHAMAEEHHKCRDAGMVDLVVKPIELEALVATVKRHAPLVTG
jgi:PAS domain S-box-containing protein